MRVSIVVTSYNYAAFLREAVDSALAQTYADVEVVVVDDGSTDGSREIITGYGDRVVAVLKENGGHPSAVNAGVKAATGGIILMLDADDVAAPNRAARVVDAFASDPRPCLVYHKLQPVDAERRPRGNPIPQAVWKGNISQRVQRSGGWWPKPTTSGLAFTKEYLEQIGPVPTGVFIDTYLAAPAPFAGRVVGLRSTLGELRLHGANMWSRGSVVGIEDREALVRQRLERYAEEFALLHETLRTRLGIEPPPMSLDDHVRFQQYRRAAGEPVSLARVVRLALTRASIPPSMRVREAARIALGRW
jgi:glycosyltransferase involved in cell wall biosynthesis